MSNRAPGSRNKQSGYENIGGARLPRSAHDLSYSHKTTCNPSKLMPLYHEEVMPGDVISWRPAFLLRQLAAVFPVMDSKRLEYQAFFVPFRLVWDNWVKMHGERTNPSDHVDYTVPQCVSPAGGWAKQSLMDYLGVPSEIQGISTSALYPRACALIWNEWYRDQNLQDSIPVPTDDGPDLATEPHFDDLIRGKRKDRFAGALPFAQKGDPVTMPLGDTAPVITDGNPIQFNGPGQTNNPIQSLPATGVQFPNAWSSTANLTYGASTGLQVDLSAATAATVNSLRQAIALQHMFERDARGGTRYSEQILSHFGVRMPDLRYRPELLCVGSVEINASEVAQTTPQQTVGGEVYFPGSLSAYTKGTGVGRGFVKTVDEWGAIIAFISVRSTVSYSQGVPASMLRRTRVDHYTPELALIGEESIPSIEIYADGTGDRDLQTGDWQPWGFTPRYQAYRHRVNMISGEMRTNGAATEFGRLDRWHYGLDFGSRPQLDSAFIEDDPIPIERNFPGVVAPPFILDCFFKVRGIRPVPGTANPGLLRF